MKRFTAIDLSELPPPDVVERLDYEAIVTQMRDDLVAAFPAIAGVIDLQSEPARKLIEVFAYRELLVRQRVNDAARAVMLATAIGADLENLAAFFGVRRAEGEPDERLRRRTGLAVEAFGAAGPAGAYQFYALSAAPELKDVTAISPEPGEVLVTLLGKEGAGEVAQDVVQRVTHVLSADHVKPLTDVLSVGPAEILAYQIEAGLIIFPGPDSEPIRQKAIAGAAQYAARRHNLGLDITKSGLYAALHVEGVQRVILRAPQVLPIRVSPRQAAFCTAIEVTVDGRGD